MRKICHLATLAILLFILTLPSQFGLPDQPSNGPGPAIGVDTHAGATGIRPFGGPGISLAPSSGPVGTLVKVNGTNFPSSASLALSFGGTDFAAPCQSDLLGNFPGTTGTSCSTWVPPMPGGPEVVTATYGPAVLNTVHVGKGSSGLAYDSGQGEVFVSNYNDNNVSVISDQADQVVANIPVGRNPWSVTYDSVQDEVWVGCYGTHNISVISDTSNTVMATIGNYSGGGFGYDPAMGEMFVGNITGSDVEVYSDTNFSRITTIPVGYNPEMSVYDPSNHDMYLALEGGGNVTVINDTTDAIVARIGTGHEASYLGYDPTLGEIFTANSYDNNVSVISDSSNKVVATIYLGSNTGPDGAAYDSQLDEFVITNDASANVSLISARSNQLVGSLPVSGYPWDAAYDPTKAEVFIADSAAGAASIIAGLSDNATFTVTTIVTTGASYDVGQTMVIDGSGYGRSVDVSTFTLGTSPLACLSATVGSCNGGTLATNSSGSFAGAFSAPQVPGSGPYTLNVTDASGYSASTTIGVDLDPSVTTPTLSRSTLDVGQSVWVNTTVSNGSGDFTFGWTGLPPGCPGVSATVSCAPTVLGNYTISVIVADSNGFVSAPSTPVALQVDPAPLVTLRSLLSSNIDAGQGLTLEANASLGQPPYRFSWTGLPPLCAPGNSSRATCQYLVPGTFTVTASVIDSSGLSVGSSPITVHVAQDPIVTLSASRTASDQGVPITFQASESGGWANLTFAWTGLPEGCDGAGETVTCSPGVTGTYDVSVQVTDGTGFMASSPTVTVSIAPALSLSAYVTTASPVVGEPVNVSSAAAGGLAPYMTTWDWGDGASSRGSNASHVYQSTGNFTVTVSLSDSGGGSMMKAIRLDVTNASSLLTPPTRTSLGWSVDPTLLLVGALGAFVVIAVVVAILYSRRRPRAPKAGPESSSEPGDSLTATDGTDPTSEAGEP